MPLAVALVVLAVVLGVAMGLTRLTGSPGGSGGGSPGSSGDGSPGSGSTQAPDELMSRFTSVTRGADGRSVEVQFWGGVEDCYRYTVDAEDVGATVALTLTEEATFEGACIDLAQQYDRTVRLDAALGSRAVVDTVTGDVLLGPAP